MQYYVKQHYTEHLCILNIILWNEDLWREGKKAHSILASNVTASWILTSKHHKVIILLVLECHTYLQSLIRGDISPHSNSNLSSSQPDALKLTMGSREGSKWVVIRYSNNIFGFFQIWCDSTLFIPGDIILFLPFSQEGEALSSNF